MSVKVTAEDVIKIEHGLNKSGNSEVLLKVESGKLVVLLVQKKRI